jgi:hypothetical protein
MRVSAPEHGDLRSGSCAAPMGARAWLSTSSSYRDWVVVLLRSLAGAGSRGPRLQTAAYGGYDSPYADLVGRRAGPGGPARTRGSALLAECLGYNRTIKFCCEGLWR